MKKDRTLRNQQRKREERRRGIRPPHQVRTVTLRFRGGNSAKFPCLVPFELEIERQMRGTGHLSEDILVQLSQL